MAKSQEQIRFELEVSKRLKELENKLEVEFKKETTGIYNALKQLDIYTKANQKTTAYDLEQFQKDMWKKVSEEWSKSLSQSITNILAKDLTLILSDIKYETNNLDGGLL